MRREGEPARDAMVEAGAVLEAEEALGRPLAGEERPVALVDVGGDQLGALGVGAGDEDGRDAADVGGEPRGVEVADRGLGRDQHLAAEVAALLLGRELVLEVNAGGACLDIGLHDLEAVQGPAEARLGVGDDRREPVALGSAFRMLDLVGALEGAVDPLGKLGPGVRRIERLVGIHRAGGVGVRGHLPAGQIDRLEARRGPSASPGCRSSRRARGRARPAAAIPTSLSAPRRASVCSIGNEPRRRSTSSALYGPLDPVEPAGRSGNHDTKISHERIPQRSGPQRETRRLW